MPAKMRKLPGKNLYKVTDSKGHVHAKASKKKDAQAVLRIIGASRKRK